MSRLIVIISTVLFACTCAADWMAEVVTDPLQEPYRYTGRLTSPGWVGSGVVVGSERTIVTAAHVVFDEYSLQWLDSINWRQRNAGSATVVRGIRYLADYADRVEAYGGESLDAFGADMAVLYAYEPLSDGGYGEPLGDPDSGLASSKQKLVTGFPSGNYGPGHVDANKMHKTGPFPSAFTHLYDQYHKLEGASHGSGGSGGGTWVQEPSGWKYAAVYIAGQRKDNWNPINSMGVVALSGVKRDLLDEVLAELESMVPPVITLDAPNEIISDWNDEQQITVEFNPDSLVTSIKWYIKDAEDPESTYQTYSPGSNFLTNTESSTTLIIPSHTVDLHNSILRVELKNDYGTTWSEETHFSYVLPPLPEFTLHPQSLILSDNMSAVLQAEIDLPDYATLTWERKRYGSSEFWHYTNADSNTPSITLRAKEGYYNGDEFRLAVTDGIQTAYSNAATTTWTDVGLVDLIIVAAPPAIAHWGEIFPLEVDMQSTVDCWFEWVIYDPSGNRVSKYSLPPGWTILPVGGPGSYSRLWVNNTIASVDGYRVVVVGHGDYYEQQQSGNKRVSKQISLYEWTLNATGPAQVTTDFHTSFNWQDRSLTIEVPLDENSEADITWQASLDGGMRWHSIAEGNEGSIGIQLDDKLNNGATLRGIIREEGKPTQHTSYIAFNSGALVTFGEDEAQSTCMTPKVAGMAISPDATTLAISQSENGNPVIIMERQGVSWQEISRFNLEGMSDSGTGTLLFPSNNRLLVANPEYSTGTSDNCGAIHEFLKQPDGQWTPNPVITLPDRADGDYFSRTMDFDGDTLVASVDGKTTPLRFFGLVGDEWQLKSTTGISSGSSEYNFVSVDGDYALITNAETCQLLEKGAHNNWVLKDSITSSNPNAPAFVDSNGNVILHQESTIEEFGQFEQWSLNHSGQLEVMGSIDALVGVSQRIYNPSQIDSKDGLHGFVNSQYNHGAYTGSALIFKRDVATGEILVATLATSPPYVINLLAMADEYLALQVVDMEAGMHEDNSWQVWLLAIDQVEFNKIKDRSWPIDLSTALESSIPGETMAKLRFRESFNPPVPVTIQSSQDGTTWTSLSQDEYTRIILDPDVDADNKTALIEAHVPVGQGEGLILLRAVEEH